MMSSEGDTDSFRGDLPNPALHGHAARESVAALRLHHLDGTWGLRGVRVKGGGQRDIPLLTVVMSFGKLMWNACTAHLRHGVAMEMLEQHHDLEQVHALLGHQRLDTTQIYTTIRPQQLKRAVAFYERQAARMLASEDVKPIHVRGTFQCSQSTERDRKSVV